MTIKIASRSSKLALAQVEEFVSMCEISDYEIVKVKNKSEIKTVDFFIQVNIGEEEQKSGVLPNNLERLYDHCINQNLNISGLMCIPPMGDNAKSYFDKIRSLRDKLNLNLKLSMGMSSDYEISLNCGSNLIRVGSLIFN